ncbi:hypothetical protein A5643_01475 [Mycobacterium sp. 1274756.6]|nr:hypothetical protein A5643_01475 [Mycobacterium sp. 1274756.6]
MRRQASTVSAKLTPLARQAGDRIAAASPMTLLAALLGLLTILSIVAALSSDTSLGATSTVLFVPAFSAALGALAMRGLIVRRRDQALADDARHDATELRQLEHTLDYIDTKLDAALTQFGSERHNDAVVAMFQAKAATELYRGAAELDRRTETRYALADFLTPAALQAGERAERPAGLSLI